MRSLDGITYSMGMRLRKLREAKSSLPMGPNESLLAWGTWRQANEKQVALYDSLVECIWVSLVDC